MYAEIIVDIAVEAVDRVFTYAVPEGMQLLPGMRVEVPFGRMKKDGFVIRLKEKADYDPEKIKPVLSAPDGYPVLLPQLMQLAEEIRERYHCPLCEAIRLMLPAEMRGNRVHIKTDEYVEVTPKSMRLRKIILNENDRKKAAK